jgi:cobalt-zinc-cadmium efflux system protein
VIDSHVHDRSHRLDTERRIAIVLALTLATTVAEVVGGIAANSLALLADAGHMLTDDLALALALAAAWLSRRPPDPGRTYGYQRAEILAALANGITLVVVCGFIFWEAARRIAAPPEVASGLMGAVAAAGFAVNVAGVWLLRGRATGLNARAVFLHLVGDLLGSVGALTAAAAIALFGWRWADPVASLAIGGIIAFGSVRLVLESVHVLMEGTPPHLDAEEIRSELLSLAGVCDVHDLHLWSLGGTAPLLTAHLVVDHSVRAQEVLRTATSRMADRFGIAHVTLQVESPDFNIVGIGQTPVDTRTPST